MEKELGEVVNNWGAIDNLIVLGCAAASSMYVCVKCRNYIRRKNLENDQEKAREILMPESRRIYSAKFSTRILRYLGLRKYPTRNKQQ
tara:strand:- start:239 stop:502 length:264 start_codon:yes stop_codon:yes gene_type:complete